jgi:phage shock protein C
MSGRSNAWPKEMERVMASSAPLYRDDTMFGVCAALGEDFGFNPNWIRALLGVGLLFAPVPTILAYSAVGFVVGISRWFVPYPAIADELEEAAAEPFVEAQVELPLAA